jgi:hypothetical protein
MKYFVIVITVFLISCSNLSEDSFSSPESSWIEGASYNTQTEDLLIETDDQDYKFSNVPLDVWEGFKNASSKGDYYHRNIRGNYPL